MTTRGLFIILSQDENTFEEFFFLAGIWKIEFAKIVMFVTKCSSTHITTLTTLFVITFIGNTYLNPSSYKFVKYCSVFRMLKKTDKLNELFPNFMSFPNVSRNKMLSLSL